MEVGVQALIPGVQDHNAAELPAEILLAKLA
jgi:hypothetical protein